MTAGPAFAGFFGPAMPSFSYLALSLWNESKKRGRFDLVEFIVIWVFTSLSKEEKKVLLFR